MLQLWYGGSPANPDFLLQKKARPRRYRQRRRLAPVGELWPLCKVGNDPDPFAVDGSSATAIDAVALPLWRRCCKSEILVRRSQFVSGLSSCLRAHLTLPVLVHLSFPVSCKCRCRYRRGIGTINHNSPLASLNDDQLLVLGFGS